jgi:hypothetical protein
MEHQYVIGWRVDYQHHERCCNSDQPDHQSVLRRAGWFSASTSASGSLKYLFMVVPGGLQPALLQTPTNPMATVDFRKWAGLYLVQLIVTDASGNTSKSGVVMLTYQP